MHMIQRRCIVYPIPLANIAFHVLHLKNITISIVASFEYVV